MMSFMVATITGLLSACGLGGGTLLLIYLVQCADMEQTVAQGINLLYFLPTGLLALPSHLKSGFLKKDVAKPAIIGGLVGASLGSILANILDVTVLQSLFSWFILLIGVYTLFQKSK